MLPDAWSPTAVDRAYAARKGWDAEKIASEAEGFQAHQAKTGGTSCDWAASWRTWVLNEPKFNRSSGTQRVFVNLAEENQRKQFEQTHRLEIEEADEAARKACT